MREKQDKPVDETQGIPATPSNIPNTSRKGNIGAIVGIVSMSIIAIAIIFALIKNRI